jgi:hypothetical protein
MQSRSKARLILGARGSIVFTGVSLTVDPVLCALGI